VADAIKSRPQTKEFDEGYSRTFGDKKPTRGRWVYDEAQQKLVPADEYRAAERALDAPIMMDRFYENTFATDGTDIGSRRKRRDYMRAKGLADADDYKETWAKAEEQRRRMADVTYDDRSEAQKLDARRLIYQRMKGNR